MTVRSASSIVATWSFASGLGSHDGDGDDNDDDDDKGNDGDDDGNDDNCRTSCGRNRNILSVESQMLNVWCTCSSWLGAPVGPYCPMSASYSDSACLKSSSCSLESGSKCAQDRQIRGKQESHQTNRNITLKLNLE